jgi:ribosomal protein L40E
MKCPKCHAENPDDAEFCSLCYTRFQVSLRSSDVDEAASRMQEKHSGAKLRCPSCYSLSPLDSQFCLRCGFVFEDLDSLMVSEEEIERIEEESRTTRQKEDENLAVEAITITSESDGAAVMRSLEDQLGKGQCPRVHAHGRQAITYAMKILAFLGEDLSNKGSDLSLSTRIIGEGSITHLDDLELEIILRSS